MGCVGEGNTIPSPFPFHIGEIYIRSDQVRSEMEQKKLSSLVPTYRYPISLSWLPIDKKKKFSWLRSDFATSSRKRAWFSVFPKFWQQKTCNKVSQSLTMKSNKTWWTVHLSNHLWVLRSGVLLIECWLIQTKTGNCSKLFWFVNTSTFGWQVLKFVPSFSCNWSQYLWIVRCGIALRNVRHTKYICGWNWFIGMLIEVQVRAQSQ